MSNATPSPEAADRLAVKLRTFLDALPADEQQIMETLLFRALSGADVEGFATFVFPHVFETRGLGVAPGPAGDFSSRGPGVYGDRANAGSN